MRTSTKEQTAFRFDPELISLMKRRAKNRKQSLNSYVTELITNDLRQSATLPKVSLSDKIDDDIIRLSSIIPVPSQSDLESDERLSRIWKR